MTTWLADQKWLTVEELPAYAYDLNPVDSVSGNLESSELANLCPDTIDDADTAVHTGLETHRHQLRPVPQLLDRARLPL
jgi:hypothetical protein